MKCGNDGVGGMVMIMTVIMIMMKRGRGNGGDEKGNGANWYYFIFVLIFYYVKSKLIICCKFPLQRWCLLCYWVHHFLSELCQCCEPFLSMHWEVIFLFMSNSLFSWQQSWFIHFGYIQSLLEYFYNLFSQHPNEKINVIEFLITNI